MILGYRPRRAALLPRDRDGCGQGRGAGRRQPIIVPVFVLIALLWSAFLPARLDAAEFTMFGRGAVWKYHDLGIDLGTEWREPEYPDSAWAAGPAPLGYSYPGLNTIVSYGSDPENKHITTYFRTSFTVSGDPSTFTALTLEANYDDGFALYLNGSECARRSIPPGPITYSTRAANHEGGTYEVINLTAFLGYVVPGVNHVAVELHQTSPSSSDLLWDAELNASNAPTLVRGPYLQVASSHAITVRWRTAQATGSVVRYGTSVDALDQIVSSPALTTEHEITLPALEPATTYYYGVGVIDTLITPSTEDFSFVTAPMPGVPQAFRIWVIGDSGRVGQDQRDVRDAYYSFSAGTRTDVWLMLGDNAYFDGTDEEYQAGVFEVYPTMLRTTPLWPTRGNHDRLHGGSDYYGIFTLPRFGEAGGVPSGTEAFYSFDFANVHFICLDSEGSANNPGSAMLNWLENDLAATGQDWVVAYWHHPPYSKGSHNSDTEDRLIEMRQNVLPVLEDGGVDLVLCGHSHSYERSYLLDEHYGFSWTLADSMILDSGDGNPSGDGAYVKDIEGLAPHAGAVYAVAGSSSQLSGGPLDHPVMVTSLPRLGSLVLDVDGGQLDARFLDDQGVFRDVFAIVKGVASSIDTESANGSDAPENGLSASPNPATRAISIRFELAREEEVSVSIVDASGRVVRQLHRGVFAAGVHALSWDGRTTEGAVVGAGVYFVQLQGEDRTRSTKVIWAR